MSESSDPKLRVDRREAWNQVWAGGVLQACAGSWHGNYGGEIRKFWQGELGSIEPQHRLLDLATGNGALPALLLELAGPAWACPEVHAVDLAEPRPPWLQALPIAQRERLHFHAGVALEALPFPAHHFDRVFSQFGFEYAERDAAVRELVRVLVPGGRVRLVCHHAGSLLAEVARSEREDLDWILSASDLPAALVAVLPQARKRAQTAAAAAARQRLNAALRALEMRASTRKVPDPLYETAERVLSLVRNAVAAGPQDDEAMLEALLRDLARQRLRVDELLSHALDADDVDRLTQSLAGFGLEPEQRRLLREGSELLAWGLGFRGRFRGRA